MKNCFLLIACCFVALPIFVGCGGTADTTKVETTEFTETDQQRMEEREKEMMSQSQRRSQGS
ncbi:hypothetical protein [Planctomycetes bacterium CA13]